jgi:hypothetical protein
MQANRAKRKTAKVADLGGFAGMFKAKQRGRVKGMPWLVKAIVNIWADYLVQEKHMARDGEPGQYDNLNHFVYKWHMSHFGLKQIAEINLVDLIATVRANASHHHVQVCLQVQASSCSACLRDHHHYTTLQVFES